MKTVDMYPKRKPDYPLLVMILLAAALIISCFTGCYTQKKATDQVNKANDKYPDVVAKLARDKYPCTDLLKPDTAILYRDTTVYIECPDSIPSTFEVIRRDTVNNTVVRTVRVPVTLPVKTVYIDRWYEDSAKLKLMVSQVASIQKENEKLQAKNDTLSARIKTRTKLMWLFVIIAAGLTVWTFRKLFI